MQTQFAADLRLARRKAGYLQSDIAACLGVQQSVVSALERGTQRPDLEQIITLSLIYGRSFEAFFEELMLECRQRLKGRVRRLGPERRQTAHTFNRAGSLRRLRHRLSQPNPYVSA
ncbi:helix-turn-helix transcriptional regulator [Yoonia sp. 2307UL14-13]|uniref:helix-turn-helix transcriptional regulator n=1 Tax=Yoonia sp. 2307UL14-13 TaxID=3126506 RepID=UPI0030A44B2A